MTKQPRFVSKLQLSKLCRIILFFGIVKLSLLLGMMFLPEQQGSVLTKGLLAVAGSPFSTSPTPEVAPPRAPDTAMPAPRVRQEASPFSQNLESNRPDEALKATAPSPAVTPMVPKDSAARKQEELNRREQELLALQQQMQSRLDELKQIEGKVETMLKQAGNTQDDKLRHLVDVYSNMKAKQAAEVLTNLDERIAVSILSGMRGRQAGEILTYMNAEKAAKLSEALTRTQLPR